MIAVALKGLAGRKLRATLTALAIVLGVAMISGTYVLTDTIDKAFNEHLHRVYAGTDAVVTGKARIRQRGRLGVPPSFPESLLERGPGAARRRGRGGQHRRLGAADRQARRHRSATQGAPTLAFGIDPDDQRFNPLELTAGPGPSARARS